MKHITLFTSALFLLLLSSCTTELVTVEITPPEEEIVVAEETPTETPTNQHTATHAYFYTLPHNLDEELYQHHLILTEGALATETNPTNPAAYALTIYSELPQLALNETYNFGGNYYRPGAGPLSHYDALDLQHTTIADQTAMTDGSITLTTDANGNLSVLWEQRPTTYNNDKMTVTGDVSLESIRPEDASTIVYQNPTEAGNSYTIGGRTNEVAAAYLKKLGNPRGNRQHYSLFLSPRELATNADNELIGFADVVLVRFHTQAGAPPSGQIILEVTENYFSSMRSVSTPAYFCTNMNFATGNMDDDDPTAGGGVQIQFEGGTVSVSLQADLDSGRPLTTTYKGPVEEVN